MRPTTLSSDRIQISFGSDPFVVRTLRNTEAGTTFCTKGRQTVLIRMPGDLSEPIVLTKGRVVQSAGGYRCTMTDDTGRYTAELQAEEDPDGIRFHLIAKAPRPIWLVEWRLSGLNLREVIVPALGGQVISRRMPVDTTLSYKYPFWWNAQFVLGASGNSGIWFFSRDAGPALKMLRVKHEQEGFAITYGFEAEGPLTHKTLEAEWSVDGYSGGWRVPVDRHRTWMERGFGLTPLTEHPSVPPWLQDIDIVLEIWGMRKDSPTPHHTFDQMSERLREWQRHYSPKRTLLYLPGFAEHGIDSHAPDYNPSAELGGPGKFNTLVRTAHRLGYRVMIHTNALAMTFTHPLFRKYARYQTVDVFGRPQAWGLDMDGDWLAEPYFAYMNPGAKAWGDLMERVLGKLIRTYKLDGIFLDQTLLAFNTSKGPNFVRGMREHVQRLSRTFPQVLFAGEGLHEQVVDALPMAQIHGIDSIPEVHGIEGKSAWRSVHPVSTYLFGPYTRFTAHLLTRHPSHPMFAWQEASYARLGVLPALCLYNAAQAIDLPAVRRMIARARRLARTRRSS